MHDSEIPRVDGVGHPRPLDDRPFDPRHFEQAIHGLQELLLRIVRLEREPVKDYDADHELDTDGEQKVIRPDEDSVLDDVIHSLPSNWDTSVLRDMSWDHSYFVRSRVDCGGGVIVRATIRVQGGMISDFEAAHTDIADRDNVVEVDDFTCHSPSREVAHLVRYLEQSVAQAYADTLPSGATAFDFLNTKKDIPASGGHRSIVRRERYENHSQKDWAEIREKTQQTVSDNSRAARDSLRELPDADPFDGVAPALEEVDEDADPVPGALRLV